MDVQRIGDGSWHFRLGPVERWVVGIGAGLLTALSGIIVYEIRQRLDEQQKSLTALITQQAVANNNLQQITDRLADVPGIVRGVAKIEVRLEEHERRINELEQVRRLK